MQLDENHLTETLIQHEWNYQSNQASRDWKTEGLHTNEDKNVVFLESKSPHHRKLESLLIDVREHEGVDHDRC